MDLQQAYLNAAHSEEIWLELPNDRNIKALNAIIYGL